MMSVDKLKYFSFRSNRIRGLHTWRPDD